MLKKKRGFIAIELLLVLLGAVLFLNLSLSTKNSLERTKLQSGARQLESMIRKSQDLAYSQGHTYYVAMFTDGANLIKRVRITERMELPQGIQIKTCNFPNNRIRFKRALAPNQGGTIYLVSKNHQVRMTVLPVTGRVKIYPTTKK